VLKHPTGPSALQGAPARQRRRAGPSGPEPPPARGPPPASSAGLIAGALLTHDRPTTDLGAGPALQPALVNLADGRPRLGVPMPIPTVEHRRDVAGDDRPALGLRVSILSGRF